MMVTGISQSGDFQKALKLLSTMHFSGTTPSEFTFIGVINIVVRLVQPMKLGFNANCGNTIDARMFKMDENEEALSLYYRKQSEGIMHNELAMASILRACSSLSALKQGKQIHAHSIKYGFGLEVPVGSALSTMFAKYRSLEHGNLDGCYAGEKLVELGSQESSAYVLLSGIYALGRREYVERVRRMMKLRGIGDICVEVGRLSGLMKDEEGYLVSGHL
ncbi:hypothetical protein FEM48_Zijuj06G0012200 [Ziziphus jujuba var. spinosa]|uniref:Pentatricopeptide repeat-containing protein n=1 Tax=Ziziphus jujuba var. spinosa TaxID=714518 RepID=A0A978V6B4_ZIZJJ|nr:hypothetical protein FEM48_Zijuj06G0012200 [Ziziphus jujuba var. spinosa]